MFQLEQEVFEYIYNMNIIIKMIKENIILKNDFFQFLLYKIIIYIIINNKTKKKNNIAQKTIILYNPWEERSEPWSFI